MEPFYKKVSARHKTLAGPPIFLAEHNLYVRTHPPTTFYGSTEFVDMWWVAKYTFNFILKAFSKSGGGVNSRKQLMSFCKLHKLRTH